LARRLKKDGGVIDAFYYCPHLVDATVERYRRACECRKPRPGLILRAASDLRIELKDSWVVGDRARDIAAGRAAGCRAAVLVKTGYGKTALQELGDPEPDFVAENLLDAAEWIIGAAG
jgi:D-glycero-D-manno-heptose 1,7-bisphosphate phosphatase